MDSVELFAGAGGLALGVAAAGFRHTAVIERDKATCMTLRENQQRGIEPIAHWPILDQDVRTLDYAEFGSNIALLAGGPPCQPFSMGGKHRGHHDQRDMFPEAVRAVRELQPKMFLFENVKGLLRKSFASYFSYIQLQLNYPELVRREHEPWLEHLARLEQHHTSGSQQGLHYRLVYRLLNAADYGVPQRRERVLIVGVRGDLDIEWSFPPPTHAQEELWHSQWVSGEYWQKHDLPQPAATPLAISNKLIKLQQRLPISTLKPWATVRDAIADLPEPTAGESAAGVLNHVFKAGARAYKGHTGSLLDEPAKTLKAGDHGVPGGENMLVQPDGSVRYFTVRESARLQGFPDSYSFPVAWTESMRQLGNAVPVPLAATIARSLKHCLEQHRK